MHLLMNIKVLNREILIIPIVDGDSTGYCFDMMQLKNILRQIITLPNKKGTSMEL